MRGQGRIFRPKVRGEHTKVYWFDYSVRGQRFRESSGTTVQKKALELLHQRMGGRRTGRLLGNPDDVTLHDLRGLVEKQYEIDGLRTKKRVTQHWHHIEQFFRAETRVMDVTESRLDDYAQARLAAGASRQTVNHELSALRRGFNLAVEKKRLARGATPTFNLPEVQNQREGFFEDGDFVAVLLALPGWAQPVVRFLRFTGWRVMEALTLTWDRVDWEGAVLRLTAHQTKGKRARLFPFGQAPEVQALLDAQWEAREGPFVFHQDGQPLSYDTLQHRFQATCKRVGVDRILHDLRRTAAREFRRTGVSEGEIMTLCGWKTRSMFDRYNIIDEDDLAAAVAKRFAPANGKQAANIAAPATTRKPLSSSAVSREG
jgi:integrase